MDAKERSKKLKEAQEFLLKNFLIMNNGVYYFKKPCSHCKNYLEAGDFANKYYKVNLPYKPWFKRLFGRL